MDGLTAMTKMHLDHTLDNLPAFLILRAHSKLYFVTSIPTISFPDAMYNKVSYQPTGVPVTTILDCGQENDGR
jgi:hypothetical protein